MKVGRVSCSSSSTMPTDPSSRRGSPRSRASGDIVRGRLDRSLLLPLATLVGPGGLRPLKVPRASVTVFMPPSSPRVLLSILAAASELEKRGGRCGRALRDEKKSGDGGCPLAWNGELLVKPRWSSECRARCCSRRRRLWRGSLAGSGAREGVESFGGGSGRFLPATAGGVRSPMLCRGAERGRGIESPRSMRRFRGHEGCGFCSSGLGRGSSGVRGVAGGGLRLGLGLRASRYSGELSLRWLASGALVVAVSLPVKMDNGWGIRLRGCSSADATIADQRDGRVEPACKYLRLSSSASLTTKLRSAGCSLARVPCSDARWCTTAARARSAGQMIRRYVDGDQGAGLLLPTVRDVVLTCPRADGGRGCPRRCPWEQCAICEFVMWKGSKHPNPRIQAASGARLPWTRSQPRRSGAGTLSTSRVRYLHEHNSLYSISKRFIAFAPSFTYAWRFQ